MDAGGKGRAQLLRRRLDDVVRVHRGRGGALHEVVLVVAADRWDEVRDWLIGGSEDEDSALARVPIARARAWLGEGVTAKWEERRDDAMDVAVVAFGGATIMRLTAR